MARRAPERLRRLIVRPAFTGIGGDPAPLPGPRPRIPVTCRLAMTAVAVMLLTPRESLAQDSVIGFGRIVFDSSLTTQSFVEVSAGGHQTAVRRANGTIAAFGCNMSGQCLTPTPPPGISYVQVATGAGFSAAGAFWGMTAALRSDGLIDTVGLGGYGQRNVPVLPTALPFGAMVSSSRSG